MDREQEQPNNNDLGDDPQAPVILCLVPDYLQMNVGGEPERDLVERFEREQQNLRYNGNTWCRLELPDCPGGYVYLSRRGENGYQIRFYNHIFYGEYTSFGHLPTFRVRIKSEILNTGDRDKIKETVDAVANYFMSRIDSMQVSRVDLAVDFQQENFEIPDHRDAVSRTRRKTFDIDKETGLESLVLGKRTKKGTRRAKDPKMQAIMYNKSTKIENSEQFWMYDIYRRTEGYDEGLPVYRVELRFFREMLREMKLEDHNGHVAGIETLEDLFDSLGDLTRVAVGDENNQPWLRFCDPETRGKDGRPPAKWWSAVAEAFKQELTVSGRVREYKKSMPSVSYMRTALLSANARTEAFARLRDPGHRRELKDFPSPHREDMEAVLRYRSTTWDEEVEKYVGRTVDSMAQVEFSQDADKVA